MNSSATIPGSSSILLASFCPKATSRQDAGAPRVCRLFQSLAVRCWRLLLALLVIGLTSPAFAHKPSDAYLTLRVEPGQITGEWHLALRDLDYAIGLDQNDDGAITWGELRGRQDAVSAYANSHLRIRDDDKEGQLNFSQMLVEKHSDGMYAVLRFAATGANPPAPLELNYTAFFELDPLHRGLLRLEQSGATRVAVFGPETATQRFDPASAGSRSSFLTFVKEGVWHIWIGYDHILFLVALLLPGVLRRTRTGWEPVSEIRPAIISVVKIVTAFTVSHSITLSLAALEIVRLPPRLVEAAIAASVALAAVNNLVRVLPERGWQVAFAFGLIHGFGFANVLADLGLRHSELAATLLGFNVGVELGQLVLVAAVFPVILALRNLATYRQILFRFGSAAIGLVATAWLTERCLDFKWLPF